MRWGVVGTPQQLLNFCFLLFFIILLEKICNFIMIRTKKKKIARICAEVICYVGIPHKIIFHFWNPKEMELLSRRRPEVTVMIRTSTWDEFSIKRTNSFTALENQNSRQIEIGRLLACIWSSTRFRLSTSLCAASNSLQ